MSRFLSARFTAVIAFSVLALIAVNASSIAGPEKSVARASGAGDLPGRQPLITLQVKDGKVAGVTGTAVPLSRRKPLGRAPGGPTVRCTINFTDVRKPEGGRTVVRWSGGVGCSRPLFLSGRAYLLETARKIAGTGRHYQGTRRRASSGSARTLISSPNPSLYVRHLTSVYLSRAARSGQITVIPASGQRLSKASRCLPVRTRAHGVGVQCDLYTTRSAFPPSGRIYEANGVVWMQNSLFAIGFDENKGSALTYLFTGGASVVNNWGAGAEIQLAFYDYNDFYDNCAGCTGKIGWNPTEAGDTHSHGSQVLSKRITASGAYFDTWANEWLPDNKGGGSAAPVPSDLHIEKWLSFVPGYSNVIHMHYRVTNVGTTSHGYGEVEFPAVYTNPPFDRMVYYSGTSPFTGAPTTTTPVAAGAPNPLYHTYHTSEMWQGLVNSDNVGVVVYVPGQSSYIQSAAFANPQPGAASNYLSTRSETAMAAGRVFQGDVYVLPGDYRAARKTIYSLHAGQSTPHIFGPVGWLDSPTAGATISGPSVPIYGWAFDDVSPVSEVKVMLDDTFVGDAAISRPRPGLAPTYPDAPANCGFAFTLNANSYTPGPHKLAVVVKSADGFTTVLRTITVNVAR